MTTKLQQFCIDILPVIQAGAKGARIGIKYDGAGEFVEINPREAVCFISSNDHQVMRNMIEVNGFKVPAGEIIKPDEGVMYFYPRLDSNSLYESTSFSHRSQYDNRIFDMGIIYLDLADAVARAKAMLGIDPCAEPEFDDAEDIPE